MLINKRLEICSSNLRPDTKTTGGEQIRLGSKYERDGQHKKYPEPSIHNKLTLTVTTTDVKQ